ncbi:MAG: hypothetical protein WAN89_07225 [Lawsonella sp.]|nr:hypothetical protein [Mycobacteriales bacterium]
MANRKVSQTKRKTLSLRLTPQTYEGVAKWAADDLRSINAQIEMLLREKLKEAGRLPSGKDSADSTRVA